MIDRKSSIAITASDANSRGSAYCALFSAIQLKTIEHGIAGLDQSGNPSSDDALRRAFAARMGSKDFKCRMSRPKFAFLVGLGALMVSVPVVIHYVSAGRSGFSGDGTFTDFGTFSYPRYRITFTTLDLMTRSNYVLEARGVPPVRMGFGLELVSSPSIPTPVATIERLRSQGAELKVSFHADDGEVVGEANSQIQAWHLARSGNRHEIWHDNLRDLRLKRSSTYRIVIELIQFDTVTNSPLIVRPTLQGGGIELP
jgi:hypothetical protein